MSLPITIPYTFASATTSIPLANLDTNFTTVVNAVNGIANGTNTLANVAITGGSVLNVSVITIGTGATASKQLNISNATNYAAIAMGDDTNGAYLVKESSSAVANPSMVHISRGPLSSPSMMVAINLNGALGFNNTGAYSPNYGTSGQVLISNGTTAPPYWGTGGGGGSGTVNSGTSGQLTYYASTGTAVSGTTTGTGVVTALALNVGQSGSIVTNVASVNTQTSTSPTLSSANNNQTVELANGTSNVSVYLPVLSTAVKVDIVQLGTGTVQLVASGGATVNSRVGATIYMSAQYSGCTVYNNSNGTLGSWIVVGDVAPST